MCPHAFIGRVADGSIATYQVLPWEHRAWHCGGKANDTHISFEICEDRLTDGAYFSAVYKEAAELCAYICTLYNLNPKNIICHSEGASMGIASNHKDVMHWFPRFGKNMDIFRADVQTIISAGGQSYEDSPSAKPQENAAQSILPGTLVRIIGNEYYNGIIIPQWVRSLNWYVTAVYCDRAVINEDESHTYRIESPISIYDLQPIDAKPSVSSIVHTVVDGDTLWNISEKYLGAGNRYSDIIKLNNLSSDIIHPGTQLNIPT